MSDLIGEFQEVHPVSNISTAADLLKQGAGERTNSTEQTPHHRLRGWEKEGYDYKEMFTHKPHKEHMNTVNSLQRIT